MSFPTRRQFTTSSQSSLSSPTNTYTFSSSCAAENLIVVCLAGDKNTGALTVTDDVGDNGGANPWVQRISQPGDEGSLYVYSKVAVGGETTITATTSGNSTTGNSGYAEEMVDDGAGAWQLVASVLAPLDTSDRTSVASGTTDTADYDGRALAVAMIDSVSSLTSGNTAPSFSNTFTKIHDAPAEVLTSGGGHAGCYVATKDLPATGTTSTTFATNGGADALSLGIIVFGRVEDVAEEKVAGDAATGADSASITEVITQDATDTATGTDSAITGIPQPGADAATTGESVSTDAELSLLDARDGVEDVFIVADLDAGTDPAVSADAAQIVIPADDSATTGFDHHIDAELYLHEPGTGGEGVSIETLYGDLVVSVYGIDPTTGDLVALPDFTDFSISPERNGWGSIRLDYPVVGQNFGLLRDTITGDRDLEIEIWSIGSPLGALRGYLQEASGDDTAETSIWTFAGGFLELRVAEAVVYPQPKTGVDDLGEDVEVLRSDVTDAQWQQLLDLGYRDRTPDDETESLHVPQLVLDAVLAGEPVPVLADPKRELRFGAVTPGELVEFIMVQARARGTLTDLGWDFSPTHDSAGNPWPSVVTTKYSPGTSYDRILGQLVDLGLIEWAVEWTGAERALRLWVPEGRGVDLTVGPRPVVLRHGRNLLDAPRKWSVRGAATALLAAGAEGVYDDAADASAEARRGRRIETSASAGQLEDLGAVEAFTQAQLRVVTPGLLEVTHGIGFLPGEPRPLIAFGVGDWVYSQTGTTLDRLRVVQWTLTVDAKHEMSGTVTLNDTVTDALVQMQRRLNALTAGETVVGTSVPSEPEEDLTPPSAPTGLVAESMAYREDATGDLYAAVTLGWLEVTTNVDGTAATDVVGYRIRYKPASVPIVDPNGNPLGEDDSWSVITQTPRTPPYTFSGVAPGIDIYIQVAAFDNDGNQSEYSASLIHRTAVDDVPPPAPSAPVVQDWFGTLRITWDGLDADGADMLEAASDFWRVDVHVSPADLFTPDATTFVASIYGATTWNVTDLPIGVTQFVRLVAYDRAGNASAASGVGSAVPRGISFPDMGPDAIGSAQIRDLAVLTAHIGEAQIVDLHVNDISVGKLTAGTLNADVLLSGNIRTALSGTRTEMDGAGIRLYNNSMLTVDLSTVTGNALITGEYRTAFNGARLVFNAAGQNQDEIWFYPSAGNEYAVLATHNHMGEVMQAAINMRGNSVRADGYTGHVGAWPPEAYIKWGALQGESVSAISCGRLHSTWWAPSMSIEVDHRNDNDDFERRVELRHRSSSGDIRGSSRLYYVESRADPEEPMWWSPNFDVGLTFAPGYLYVGNRNGAARDIAANNVVSGSSRTIKRDERPIDFGGLRAVDVVHRIESKTWNYDHEPTGTLPHFFPIAEDIAEVAPELVGEMPGIPGGLAIGLRDVVGVLWQAVRELAAEVRELKR